MRALLCLFLVGCTGTDATDKDATTGSDETDDSDSDSGTGDTDTDSGTGDVDSEPLGPIPYDGANPGFKSLLTDDGSEFVCEYVEESCPTDCDGNVAPVLSASKMFVNGVESNTVVPGDHVVVRIGYSDDDCNLACGSASQFLGMPEMEEGDFMSLCSNYPCEGESGFVFGTVTDEGDYSWSMKINDNCGASSALVTGSFTL